MKSDLAKRSSHPLPNPMQRLGFRAALRDCVLYELCDTKARASGWRGFSCSDCECYRAKTLDDMLELIDPEGYTAEERRHVAECLLRMVPRRAPKR